jgi:hypothetical protein
VSRRALGQPIEETVGLVATVRRDAYGANSNRLSSRGSVSQMMLNSVVAAGISGVTGVAAAVLIRGRIHALLDVLLDAAPGHAWRHY